VAFLYRPGIQEGKVAAMTTITSLCAERFAERLVYGGIGGYLQRDHHDLLDTLSMLGQDEESYC
jgi:hypothetical protein